MNHQPRPAIPTIALIPPDHGRGGWLVMIRRSTGPFAVGPYPSRRVALGAAALIRGALADAYHAGRRAAERDLAAVDPQGGPR